MAKGGVRRAVQGALAALLLLAPSAGADEPAGAEAAPTAADASGAGHAEGTELLPGGQLFEPLLADPRWPHFSASYQHYLGDKELGNVAATNFGGTIGLVRGDAPLEGRWQLDLQAGVFAIFDLDAPSFDLVNSDYMVGLGASYRRRDVSALLRFYHQSSHLGDEYLLRNTVERVNLSYEVVDVLVSRELRGVLRLYAGGGYMVHREPADIEPGILESGFELRSPWTLWTEYLRPIAAVDVKAFEESNWRPDVSARAGLQLESARLRSHRLQLLAEYFDGRSPNGQFFGRTIQYVGLGLHFYF